jgi:micrococcal nuclease
VVARAVIGGTLGVVAALVVGLVVASAQSTPSAASVTPIPADAQPMIVREVLSGDTVVLSNPRPGPQVVDWGDVSVRLIGVYAPHFGLINECYAVESQGRLRQLLPKGSLAWVATDTTAKDDNGRWLMYVWTSTGEFVNLALADEGFVTAVSSYDNESHFSAIAQATEQAFRRHAGLWGACVATGG